MNSRKSKNNVKNVKRLVKPVIVAHRGASAYAPENSLTACRLAVDMDVDMIELDVRATLDHVLVLHHNRGIRVKRKRFWIDRVTFKELLKLKPGIVTLEQVISEFGNRTGYDVDIKQTGIEGYIVDLLKKYKIRKQIVADSSNIGILWRFKELYPESMTMFYLNVNDNRDIFNNIFGRLLYLTLPKIFKFLGPHIMAWRVRGRFVDAVSFDPPTIVTRKIILDLHEQGILVFAAPINSASMMYKLWQWGIDGVKTDKPDVMKKVVNGELIPPRHILPVRLLRRLGGKVKRAVVSHVSAN